ncbi:hypothetical protein JOF53_000405 [Crossiella equi]|uniref:Uncharacterized protein n=1 Tax=Crossiella equi TaxID=130796 RepID=A0ABS5A4N2_9PSEU|nr:hypothetical protein [Crossiella equi]MBP2471533.1 hypothetical protein [Crossiella equi]
MTTDRLLSCMHSWTWTVQHAPLVPQPGPSWRLQVWPREFGVSIVLTLYTDSVPWREVRPVFVADLIGARDCGDVGRALNRVVAGMFRLGGRPVPEHYESAERRGGATRPSTRDGGQP